MTQAKLRLVRFGYARQWDAKCARCNGETPQRVAQLLGQPRLIDRLSLKYALADEAKELRGFLGKSRARVEKAVAVVEGGIDGPQRGALIVVESHGVTRS